VSTKTSTKKREAAINMAVTEVREHINEIRKQPNDLFEMIRADVKKNVDQYMSELMDTEMTEFLGRKRYERIDGISNLRNGSYARKYALKGIGEVDVRVPGDRNADFDMS
jgi:transposase-like protein